MAWQRRQCGTLRYVEACAYDGVKISQQFVHAADKREAIIAKIDKRLGYSAAHDKDEEFGIAVGDIETVFLDMPAADGEALLWKVKRLYEPGTGIWTEGVEDQTIADLHRFLSNGRA